MRRMLVGAAGSALAIVLLGPPVLAQSCGGYQEPACTTTTAAPTTTTAPATTTTRPATTTTRVPPTTSAPTTTPVTVRGSTTTTPESEESTTTSQAPPPSIVKPAPPRVDITAGETVQVIAETNTSFDPEADPPSVTLSTSGDDATTVLAIVTVTVNEEGELVIEVEVPEDTPESIITVTIVAIDSRGVQRTIVYLFPVRAAPSTTTTLGDGEPGFLSASRGAASNGIRWADLTVVPDAEVPAVVKAIQAAIPDDATEQALLAALEAEPNSVLTVDGDVANGTLAVSVRPIDVADGSSRGLVAALSLAAAGVGLIALRRRSLAASTKESR